MWSPSRDPAEALAQLREAAKSPTAAPLPNVLRVAAIRRVPEVFQPRGETLAEHHVQTLVKAIRNQGALDPVLVIQLGGSAYLIDGHHRVEAYELAGFRDPVPVEYFLGPLDDAILEAGRTNSKAKLPMTPQERQNFAWRLVRMGGYSKRRVREAASVSDGLVATMRRAQTQLGERADEYPEWWRARNVAKGLDAADWTDDEREVWKKERASALAEKLAKAWGSKPIQQWEVAAMALEYYFGRRLPELVRELQDLMPEVGDDEEDYGF